jgi:hypothetical protein
MHLMHVGKEPIADVIQGIGLISFPPDEPVEVKDDYIATTLMERLKLRGLIQVPEIRSRQGVTFDLEGARKAARSALAEGKKKLLDNYLKEQKDRISSANHPLPLPPSPVVQQIIEEQGIDLKDYGIVLGGVKIDNKPEERIATLESAVHELIEQNKLLMGELGKVRKSSKE